MFLTIVTFGRDRLMGTGRNGESYEVSEKTWRFRFFKDLTIIDHKSKLHTITVL